ncbi:astacin [Ancylostoma duodenale]|uniref:Zinc metalloproteinase n=1 Tax=Ancylostoma duodenale TaxID=51022 RepID=A0A0C2H2F2_9BILA|nr:astacin [Ancylostoma duodenale]
MRVLLLVLLLAICAGAGFFDTKLGQKIKKTLGKIKALLHNIIKFSALNGTLLMAIREKFIRLRERIKAKLTLSPARKALLGEILKHITHVKKDRIQEKGDSIEEINENSDIGELLYQGDIVLTHQQAQEIVEDIEGDKEDRAKRQAFRNRNYPRTLWSNGVYYYFHRNATPDKIRVFKEKGCWSYIGRIGGQQDLSLGHGCGSVGTAAHEIGHAIGFYRTQSRHDRDNFITFNPQNVKPDWLDQFAKQTTETNENYGITYDYGSIMHYGANSATQNGRPTMVPHDPKYVETLGSPIISFYELLMTNTHYECTSEIRFHIDTLAYAKQLFNLIQRIAIQLLLRSVSRPDADLYTKQPLSINPSMTNLDEQDKYQGRIWTSVTIGSRGAPQLAFQAPQGSKIEIKIAGLSRGSAVDGCKYWGVEIKTHADQRLTGYRFCAPEHIGVRLVSNFHIVPMITYNRIYPTSVNIQYRIVGGNVGGLVPQPRTNNNCVDNQE